MKMYLIRNWHENVERLDNLGVTWIPDVHWILLTPLISEMLQFVQEITQDDILIRLIQFVVIIIIITAVCLMLSTHEN